VKYISKGGGVFCDALENAGKEDPKKKSLDVKGYLAIGKKSNVSHSLNPLLGVVAPSL